MSGGCSLWRSCWAWRTTRDFRPFSGWSVRFVSASEGSGGVLSIGKLGASQEQLLYYEQQISDGIEDYYTGRGEAPGEWIGTGAAALGLRVGEQVGEDGFWTLMSGLHPADLSPLLPIHRRCKVSAFDLTFSAPKSVSVLFAVGDASLSADLVAAHDAAAAAAVGYLEREACWTRRGRGGVVRLRGEGFLGTTYRHRLSRARDPQLHTHVVVANMTRADGRYTSLDARDLFQHKNAAGAVYRAVLRAEVRERLPWVVWKQVSRGLFEIDGVPEGVLRHFSQRRAEIEARRDAVAGVGAKLSRAAMQTIALSTRQPKDMAAEAGADWRMEAHARAAEHGFGAAELAALLARPAAAPERTSWTKLVERLSGPEGLTEKRTTFARQHALAEIAGVAAHGATLEDIELVTNRYLADPTLERVEDGVGGEPLYSTKALLECERAICNSAEHRLDAGVGVVDDQGVDAALDGAGLNHDQETAVRLIATSGNGVDTVQALAGTGKTTMLRTLADAYERAGYAVFGAAPSARAARELRESAGITANTIHGLVAEIDRRTQESRRHVAPDVVFFIDEAGMAGTRISARLFAHAEAGGAKIVAVGDAGQLPSVEAGGWFAALVDDQQGATLRDVMRQRGPEERAALAALHDGLPERYLNHKAQDITLHATDADALDAAVDRWAQLRQAHGADHAVMIVRDNAAREHLNALARERLRAAGELAHEEVAIAAHVWAVGDRVIARRNDRRLDVDNGTTGTVTAVTPDHQIVLRIADDTERTLPPEYVARHLEHAYAITGHASQGATVEAAVVIGRPEEFTREWAYTALSRARGSTSIELITATDSTDAARADYAPEPAPREPEEALQVLVSTMKRSEAEPLALHRAPDRSVRPTPDRVLYQDLPVPSADHARRL